MSKDIISEDKRHEAATEEPSFSGCPALGPKVPPSGFDGVEPGERGAYKHGLLANGVQMIRYASGPMVTLVGKRKREPYERQGGRTEKIIYKVTISRESHTASVDVDGVNKISLVGTSLGLLECGALSMLNCIIKFNARQQRHKKERLNRRKAEAAAKEGK